MRIFGAFDGVRDCAMTAGDQRLHEFWRNAKCWRAFRGVENGEASAGACTDVDQAATVLKGAHDGIYRASDGGEFTRDGEFGWLKDARDSRKRDFSAR